jgi:hypothetical protein
MVVLLRAEPNKPWWRTFVGLRRVSLTMSRSAAAACASWPFIAIGKAVKVVPADFSAQLAVRRFAFVAPGAGKLKVIYDRIDA